MDDDRVRIRVGLSSGELEIEGTESFVKSYAEKVDALLDLLVKQPFPKERPRKTPAVEPSAPAVGAMPATFGEYFHRVPKSATDVDKVLVAGYFSQSQSPDDWFTTGDANKLLTDQGVKVGNASQCVKQALRARRLFAVQKGKYRVSTDGGVEYLDGLLQQ